MKCSWNKINLGWRLGNISEMVEEAIQIANLLDTKVSFEFNGVKVNLSKHSDHQNTVRKVTDAVGEGKTIYGEGC